VRRQQRAPDLLGRRVDADRVLVDERQGLDRDVDEPFRHGR
jgi:hypothetical protein